MSFYILKTFNVFLEMPVLRSLSYPDVLTSENEYSEDPGEFSRKSSKRSSRRNGIDCYIYNNFHMIHKCSHNVHMYKKEYSWLQ